MSSSAGDDLHSGPPVRIGMPESRTAIPSRGKEFISRMNIAENCRNFSACHFPGSHIYIALPSKANAETHVQRSISPCGLILGQFNKLDMSVGSRRPDEILTPLI